jgi:N-acyl-D-amino-acid deacylase
VFNISMIKANLEMNFDVLIKDGFIVDGTGGPWYKADIGIKNRKISDIGTNLATKSSDIVIDAKGHVVSSGFFDMHAHSELTYFKHPTADNKILQGITTEVSGNCGGNLCGPIKGMAIELLKKSIEKEEIPGLTLLF